MTLAITVQQPWAWAIIHGGKNVENRTGLGMWKRATGQRIAIHAGQRWSDRGARSGLVWQALERYGWPVGPDAANRRGLFHSGEKPPGLVEPMVEFGCPRGGLVLDPFSGSASTAIASRAIGRRTVLIEKRESQCEASAKRLTQSVLDFGATV